MMEYFTKRRIIIILSWRCVAMRRKGARREVRLYKVAKTKRITTQWGMSSGLLWFKQVKSYYFSIRYLGFFRHGKPLNKKLKERILGLPFVFDQFVGTEMDWNLHYIFVTNGLKSVATIWAVPTELVRFSVWQARPWFVGILVIEWFL